MKTTVILVGIGAFAGVVALADTRPVQVPQAPRSLVKDQKTLKKDQTAWKLGQAGDYKSCL